MIKICNNCGQEFNTVYESCNYNRTATTFCSIKCSNNSRVSYNTAEELEKLILDFISSENRYCTIQQVTRGVKISTKTLVKYGIKIRDINNALGFTPKVSAFQESIHRELSKYTTDITSEYTNASLLSPRGFNLRIDFYLQKLNVFVEADGTQHYNENDFYYSEYGVLCDNIKNEYAKVNNIPMIRIPYKLHITEDYIKSFIEPFLINKTIP